MSTPRPAMRTAARASNGGGKPPDLSVIIKARHHGPQYVYSLIPGYETPPAGLSMTPTQHYNPYFASDLSPFWKKTKEKTPEDSNNAMPPPLMADQVTFD